MDFVEYAIDAVANPKLLFKRLDVDVGRPALHSVGEDAVDQLHHRRVLGQVLRLDLLVLLLLDDLEVGLLGLDALQQALQLRVRLLVVPLDRVAQRVLPGDHREHVAAGDELDILDRRDVVGIGDRHGEGAAFALRMTGDLQGCLYVFVDTAVCSPSGTYRETGAEIFIGQYNQGSGSFRTSYLFTAKYEDCSALIGEIFGRCQHPLIVNSGTGVFQAVTGRLDFKDDVEAGNFPYRGHLQ